MENRQDNSDERLEGMLRRWGADEAASDYRPGEAPLAAAGAPARRGWRMSAVWAVAASIIAVAAAAVTIHLTTGPPTEGADRPEAHRAALQALEAEAARLRGELEQAGDDLEAAGKEMEKSRGELAATTRQAEDWKAKYEDLRDVKLAELKLRMDAAQRVIAEREASLELVKEHIEKLRKERDDALAKSQAEPPERKRLAAAIEEMRRLQKLHDEALASKRQLEDELVKLRARQSAFWQNAMFAYVSASSEGDGEGLADWQAASRHNRLSARCAELRPSVPSISAQQLMDRLEVVLLRLEMLDPYNLASMQSFGRLIRGHDLAGQIDDALSPGMVGAPVRRWFFEVKLVLMGVESAG